MSFDDMDHGGVVSLRGGGYQSGPAPSTNPGAGANGEWDRLHGRVTSTVTQISNAVAALQKLSTQLGGKKDSEELRQRLQGMSDNVREMARGTNGMLRQMVRIPASPAEEQRRRVVQNKLGSDLKKSLSAFTAVQERIKASDERAIRSAQQQLRQQGGPSAAAAEEEQPLLQVQSLDNAIAFNEELITSRSAEIDNIAATVQDVHDIFRDLATLVDEQGDMLHDVEQHIDNTVAHTDGAVVQLGKASEYQRKARRKAMCLLVVFLLIGGGVVLYLTQISKK